MNIIQRAFNIAKKSLRRCYSKKGILAGLHHFKDYWARDGFFASYGSLELGDYEIVKKNLCLFLDNISKDGQIPLRIGRRPHIFPFVFIGFKIKRKALFTFDFNNKPAVDNNSLFIISFGEYIKKTKELGFLKKNIAKIEKIFNWNFRNDKDNDLLIEEPGLSNWADSVKKKGKVLYTNACHYKACAMLSELFYLDKNKEKSYYYRELSKKIKKAINSLFWKNKYYLDWIKNKRKANKGSIKDSEKISKKQDSESFSSAGNFLSVIWGISDKGKAKKIMDYSKSLGIMQPAFKDYNKSLISFPIKMIGLYDYHSRLSWLWIGCLRAIALNKIGLKKESLNVLRKMSKLIIRHNTVYEVYEKDMPVKRLFYRSEHPFAWSSGMFVYAVKKIFC